MIRVGRLFQGLWFYLYLKQHNDDEAFFSSNSCIVILNYLQMWTKLNEVGSEMISLSRSLSEISTGCFRAQVRGFLLTLGSLSFCLLHTMLVKLM